jgi:amino acid transporter
MIGHIAGAYFSFAPFYHAVGNVPATVFGAFSIAVLSFLGFDAISTLSEEARGGPKAVARATMLSLVICATLFVAQTWFASVFLHGKSALPDGDETNEAFYRIVDLVGGRTFEFVFAVPGIVLAGFAGAVAAQVATARLVFGMARDGRLPRILARVDARRHSPVAATILVSVVTLITSLLLVDNLEFLTSMVSFGALVGFLALHISVITHFAVRHRSNRWFRHIVSPLIGSLSVGYVILNTDSQARLAGMLWLFVGALVLGTVRWRGRAVERKGMAWKGRKVDAQ